MEGREENGLLEKGFQLRRHLGIPDVSVEETARGKARSELGGGEKR